MQVGIGLKGTIIIWFVMRASDSGIVPLKYSTLQSTNRTLHMDV